MKERKKFLLLQIMNVRKQYKFRTVVYEVSSFKDNPAVQ